CCELPFLFLQVRLLISAKLAVMLHQRYSSDAVAAALLPREAWRPYPALQDRAAWEALPVAPDLVRRGEAALAAEWPALPATLYLEFARDGNRSRFQEPYFRRRSLLCDLVLAECTEGRGRFLDGITNAAWSLCEESSWVLPAHINAQRAGVGLPDTAEPVVDLFAAETAALLAWIPYLLGPALDGVSPLVCPRIVREIQHRILTPCLQRDDFWWMGLLQGSRPVNNWNPWINSNWLACALLLEEDPERRQAAVAKSMRSLDVFIDGYPEDGGCDEGPSYWGRAGASLFDCLELLHSATGGAVDVFAEPKIGNIGRFIYRAHIAGRWFINFADAPARLIPNGPLVFRYGRAIGDAAMQSFGAWLATLTTQRQGVDSLPRQLPGLFTLSAMESVPAVPPLPRDVWLSDTQVMVARPQGGSDAGLFLAAKGGHNAESHNHNDVGHFVVFADGKPVLIDIGVETYSRKTFSSERYTIWTMQSQYHNLPTVNGVMQSYGREFAAHDLHYSADDEHAQLALDIAGAYPPDAGIQSWQRTFTFAREGCITVTDHYRLAELPRELFFSLMTPCAVSIDPAGSVTLGERSWGEGLESGRAMIRFPADRLTAGVEEIAVDDPQLQGAWGDRLYRILLRAANTSAREDEITVRIESLSGTVPGGLV
ncbi:MAG: heparinase II/III domain-containing protein, partial [Armatimonadota bacterium]